MTASARGPFAGPLAPWAASGILVLSMGARVLLACLAVLIVVGVDAALIRRVLSAYRSTRRPPHLVIALGIATSGVTTAGAAGVFAVAREPSQVPAWAWDGFRAATMLGAAVSYGLVGVFTAYAFRAGSRAAHALALAGLAALVGLAAAALWIEPATVESPATLRWSLRVPFVTIGVSAGVWAALEARRLRTRLLRRGTAPDPVALGRMRAFGGGAAAIAVSQVALLGYAPGGDWAHPLGYLCAAALLLGALVFVLGCVATWATPQWLRARWEGTA